MPRPSRSTKVAGSAPAATLIARPRTWLAVTALGLVLTGLGLGTELYRHHHGAAPAEVIRRSSPGFLVSLAGVAIGVVAALIALSLYELGDDALAPPRLYRRAITVLTAWTAVTGAAAALVAYLVVAGPTVGGRGQGSRAISGTDATGGSGAAVTLHGSLTLDGVPLDAQFLGARAIRDGLLAACQASLPSVARGTYQIDVLADAASRGCGAPGATIVVWTISGGHTLYSETSVAWPTTNATVTFDSTFSSANAAGVGGNATQFYVRPSRDGVPVRGGASVEARIGGVLCGTSTVRNFDGDHGAIILVAGPERAGCARGAPITFVVDGTPARETATNDLSERAGQGALTLTVP